MAMNLDSSSLPITVRDILYSICTTASKFEKEVFKIGRRISRSLVYAECGLSMLLFCNEWKRNEQRSNTHMRTQPSLPLP